MIYIDPSELRETSNLLRHLSDVVYTPLPGLEALTGADVMITPQLAPRAYNDDFVITNIRLGAMLIQIKFGHDLPMSIMDDRIKEAQSRMESVGAQPLQRELLNIGLYSRDDTAGYATVNGQLTYGNRPMRWIDMDASNLYWVIRGGFVWWLSSGKFVADHFANVQAIVDLCAADEAIREYFPKLDVYYEEIESSNPILRKWGVGQKLTRVEDLRRIINAIPGAKVGPERAKAIYDWMAENGIKRDIYGLIEIVKNGRILEVPGIGKNTAEAMSRGLFMTSEERKAKND